jgi:hypothetical protein
MYEKLGLQKEHLQSLNDYALKIEIFYLGKEGRGAISSDEESLCEVVDHSVEFNPLYAGGNRETESPSYESMSFDEDEERFYDAEESYSQNSLGNQSQKPFATAHALLSYIDGIVPIYIDIISGSSGCMRVYMIKCESKLMLIPEDLVKEIVRASKCGRVAKQQVHEMYSYRLSSEEKMRRIAGLTMYHDSNNLSMVCESKEKYEDIFLRRVIPALSTLNSAQSHLSSYAARAISEHHWVEEWCIVTDHCISFYQPRKRSAQFQIELDSILYVRKHLQEEPDIPDKYFFSIDTLGRSVYIMFNEESTRDSWLQTITRLLNVVKSDDTVIGMLHRLNAYDPASEYLTNSTKWRCKGRRILNSAEFATRSTHFESPLAMVETALRLSVAPTRDNDHKAYRMFLASTSALKGARLELLHDENARVAFFLNLYHLMINHAFMVLGVPSSSRKWISYFNHVAYEVDDEIFSLTELEHNIIRANMSYPSQFIARFVIPKSKYSMALKRPDYRYNFALNCGSLSNPSGVFVYTAEKLSDQLDAACRLSLERVVVIRKGVKEVQITLPRVCQWFLDDFGPSKDLLTKVSAYLKPEEQAKLKCCVLSTDNAIDMSCVTLRFEDYNFNCAPLTLVE